MASVVSPTKIMSGTAAKTGCFSIGPCIVRVSMSPPMRLYASRAWSQISGT